MATPTLDPLVRARRPDAPAAPYDFARPRAVSDRQRRAVEAVHAALADDLSAALADALGEPAAVRVRSADEVTAQDYERSRSRPAAVFVAQLGAGGPALALDVATPLALCWVERHLGGADPLGADGRALSDLERSVVERHWLPAVWAAFARAWGSVPPRPTRFAADPALVVLDAPDAPVLVVDLEVSVGDGSAVLSLCYPVAALQLLSGVPASAGSPDGGSAAPLDDLPLTLRAELGRARLTVGDLVALAPGDVVPLGVATDAPVRVQIGDRVEFQARAGASGGRLALEALTLPAPLLR